ncbi:hypothetical protein M885DRAFT_520982 [Pelagophyceae sp. CCMP2097]|nr:hypothetical protein M885DRAFT_520982 [Pelagophyceae sp. CCMP2097]
MPRGFESDAAVLDGNEGEYPLCRGALAPADSQRLCASQRKYAERDIFVSAALGFPIDRFFEYVDEATFRFTHAADLGGLRRSVVDDVVRQCRAEKRRRRGEDALWRREKLACRAHAVGARADAGALVRVGDETHPDDFGIDAARITPTGMNLLYHALATVDGPELLLATPHLRRVCDGVYEFDFLDAGYCARLYARALAFRVAARADCSAAAGEQCPEPPRICLDKMGLSHAVSDALLTHLVRPLAARLFPRRGGATLDHHVAFVDTRSALTHAQTPDEIPTTRAPSGFETYDCAIEDDAEVCLDICLAVENGRGSRGGATRHFLGSYDHPCAPPVEFAHLRPGRALLYAGNVRHRRLAGNGERASLVLWCRSTKDRDEMAVDGDAYYEQERLYGPSADGQEPDDDDDYDYSNSDCDVALLERPFRRET